MRFSLSVRDLREVGGESEGGKVGQRMCARKGLTKPAKTGSRKQLGREGGEQRRDDGTQAAGRDAA